MESFGDQLVAPAAVVVRLFVEGVVGSLSCGERGEVAGQVEEGDVAIGGELFEPGCHESVVVVSLFIDQFPEFGQQHNSKPPTRPLDDSLQGPNDSHRDFEQLLSSVGLFERGVTTECLP